MSSRTKQYLTDILESSHLIREYLVGETLESYRSNRLLQDEVERRLLTLSEADFRLREQAGILSPAIDWREIRGLGNFLRHEYDKVDDSQVWAKIHQSLPSVKTAVATALAELEKGSGPSA